MQICYFEFNWVSTSCAMCMFTCKYNVCPGSRYLQLFNILYLNSFLCSLIQGSIFFLLLLLFLKRNVINSLWCRRVWRRATGFIYKIRQKKERLKISLHAFIILNSFGYVNIDEVLNQLYLGCNFSPKHSAIKKLEG